MSHDNIQKRTYVYPAQGAGITTDLVDFGGSTGVCAVMNFGGQAVEVVRFGLVVDDNELLDVGAGFTLALKKYLVPGSATNAVTLGTLTTTTDIAKGAILMNELSAAVAETTVAGLGGHNNNVQHAPRDESDNDYIVLPGQQLVFDLTDAADTSGKGTVWVEVIERGAADLNKSSVTVTRVTS